MKAPTPAIATRRSAHRPGRLSRGLTTCIRGYCRSCEDSFRRINTEGVGVAVMGEGAERRSAHRRARPTLLWACKPLVGFRNLDEQVLRLTIFYEVGKVTRVFCSFLPGLIGQRPCRRLYKQAILKGFPGIFYRSHIHSPHEHMGVSIPKTPAFCFHPSPRLLHIA